MDHDILNDRCRKAVAAAADLARSWGHEFVGTEHLLIALARSQGPATHMLARCGVTADQLEAAARHLLGDCIREPQPATTG